jgi:CelD/BcsL family acetyltransferase involved in cellulose biosynthesis
MAVNPEFASYSPGSLLTLDCLDIAIRHGVDFDFRITSDTYKKRWIDAYDPYEGYWLACSTRGKLALLIDKIKIGARALRVGIAAKLSPLLKRLGR